ncbi:hypothetical protein TRVA0_085S00144 [Trichomonascus vanleenenianus]|uniref:uncharacterized protein n=1 Tax=Trichomonascus vanleenenianus TaxID=2268995 RepID=UPI003EC99317
MGRRSELVDKHTIRVGRANKSEFKVACRHCREAGQEVHFVSRTDAVLRHLNVCRHYTGQIPLSPAQQLHQQQQQGRFKPHAPHAPHPELNISVTTADAMAAGLNAASPRPAAYWGGALVPAKRSSDGSHVPRATAAWTEQMERLLLQTLVSLGLPFSAVEDRCFRELLEHVNPAFKSDPRLLPTRDALADRIWKAADMQLRSEVMKELNTCKKLTLTLDSWFNCANRQVFAFVMRTPPGKSLAWEWKDVASKSPGELHASLSDITGHIELASKIVGVVVTKSAARYLNSDGGYTFPPETLFLKCYDEELNYLASDCLGVIDQGHSMVSLCNALITFVSHYLDASLFAGVLGSATPPVAFPLRLDSKWAATTACLRVVLNSWDDIRVPLDNAAQLEPHSAALPSLPPDKAVRRRELAELLRARLDEDGVLARLNAIYALAALMAAFYEQSVAANGTRLRMVLPHAAKLYGVVDKLARDSPALVDADFRAQLDKRLKTWDVRLLILATVFDPLVKRALFRKDTAVSETAYQACEEAYKKLFGGDTTEVTKSLLNYMTEDIWPFTDMRFADQSLETFYWEPLVKTDHADLSRLAVRLESCVVSAVDTERLFGDMGSIHSPLKPYVSQPKPPTLDSIARMLGTPTSSADLAQDAVDVSLGLASADENLLRNDLNMFIEPSLQSLGGDGAEESAEDAAQAAADEAAAAAADAASVAVASASGVGGEPYTFLDPAKPSLLSFDALFTDEAFQLYSNQQPQHGEEDHQNGQDHESVGE